MSKNSSVKIIVAGLASGFIGNRVLGALFSIPLIQAILCNPEWQNQLFIDISPKRNLDIS